MSDRIEQATREWAYDEIEADYDAGQHVWREVSEGFYWQALEVVPPVYAPGGFLVGEAWKHTANDEPVRAAFTKIGKRYFATIATAAEFPARRSGLIHTLRADLWP